MSRFRTWELSDPAFERDGLCQITVASPALGRRGDISLFVPDGLAQPAPLIVLLHGVYGSHWCWAMKGGAHVIAAAMIRDGSIPPCVIAMPSDGLWGEGSGYVPHAGSDPERWIVDDVPAAAALACDHVDPSARFALGGVSMGGFGALRLAAKYRERIHAAAGLSSITRAADLGWYTADDRSEWSDTPEDSDIVTPMLAAGYALPRLRFDCGRDDPLLDDNRALATALTGHGVAHSYHEHDGGHSWPVWRERLPHILTFLSYSDAE